MLECFVVFTLTTVINLFNIFVEEKNEIKNKMKTCLFITLFITVFIKAEEWALPDRLFELCPFTSFCENNASKPFPYATQYTPCCSPCSCSDDCGLFQNCCHRDLDKYNKNANENLTTACRSTLVSHKSVNFASYYKMIDACSGDLKYTGNATRCENNDFNTSKAFYPVYSPSKEMIYLSSECANCNNVTDGIKWQKAISCMSESDDEIFDNAEKLIQDKDAEVGSNCMIYFYPPNGFDLTKFKCKPEIIRACNVSGIIKSRDESWDLCTSFNATFSQPWTTMRFGNIFCYMCNRNEYRVQTCIDENLGQSDDKFNTAFSFTVVLDTTEIKTQSIQTGRSSQCRPSELFVKSFKRSCRPKRCPLGQRLLNGRCDFYSTLWYGTSFYVVLKLTPINNETFPGAFFSKMADDDKKNKLAPWLQRGTMQDWYVIPLIQTSEDQKFVRYIIANVTYPLSYVRPSYLHDVIKQAVSETWFLKNEEQEYPLSVKLNEIISYTESSIEVLHGHIGISAKINKTLVFLAEYLMYDRQLVSSDDYLFPLYPTTWIRFMRTGIFLTKLFFCEQVDLLPEEYTFSQLKVYFKVTNKTLYDAEFRVVNEVLKSSGSPVETVRICIDEFEIPINGYLSSFNANNHLILLIFICLFAKILMFAF